MADPYIGEIRMFTGNFAPKGYASCDGQILPINQNQALFSILGTTYGGNGTTNFALPDLRGRAPMHWGAGPGLSTHQLGAKSGQESVTLTGAQLPPHSHALRATSTQATQLGPGGNVLARGRSEAYVAGSPSQALHSGTLGSAGGSQPHPNMQPFLAIRFIIAMVGLYPPHS